MKKSFTGSFSDFLKSVADVPKEMKFQEKTLSCDVKRDGKLASVWAVCEFYVNGNLSHKGVDAFKLFKEKHQWKIISLVYNIR